MALKCLSVFILSPDAYGQDQGPSGCKICVNLLCQAMKRLPIIFQSLPGRIEGYDKANICSLFFKSNLYRCNLGLLTDLITIILILRFFLPVF